MQCHLQSTSMKNRNLFFYKNGKNEISDTHWNIWNPIFTRHFLFSQYLGIMKGFFIF